VKFYIKRKQRGTHKVKAIEMDKKRRLQLSIDIRTKLDYGESYDALLLNDEERKYAEIIREAHMEEKEMSKNFEKVRQERIKRFAGLTDREYYEEIVKEGEAFLKELGIKPN